MKRFFAAVLSVLSFVTYAQDKNAYVHFNKLTEVTGTSYTIASVENVGKMFVTNAKYLLFINTKTAESKQVDFPVDAYIEKVEQVKIDSLGINRIIVAAMTVDLDGDKSIDWNDPKQIIVLSTDGQEKIQLTDSKFFARTWAVNRQTGILVVTGHYDTNNNRKYDKTDKSEILLYDLKTLKLAGKL